MESSIQGTGKGKSFSRFLFPFFLFWDPDNKNGKRAERLYNRLESILAHCKGSILVIT